MATYFVDPVSGNDSNAGTSFALAWATTQKALDTVAAGDEIRVCATGTESPSATIDLDITAGTTTAPITIVGYSSDGTTPLASGSHYTISGASLPANADLIACMVAAHLRVQGVRLTAAKRDNFAFISSPAGGLVIFRSCRLDNAVAHGLSVGRSGTPQPTAQFIDCDIDSNGGAGVTFITANRGSWRLLGCRVFNNSLSGVQNRTRMDVIDCLIYGNGNDGLYAESSGSVGFLIGNTIYGNAGDGIDLFNYDFSGFVGNNTIVNNGAFGIRYANQTVLIGEWNYGWNHTHGNTSGATNRTEGMPGINNASGDPLFADAGAADFTPQVGSPLIGAGSFGSDIGAIRGEAASGSSNPQRVITF